MIVFTANGRCAKIKAVEPITTGSVGMPVSVVLSGDFDGLATTMVFACGDVSADVALLGQEVTVPPQVLEEAGRVLEIGVYGARADGTIVIPTVWAKAGIVHEGVLPSGVDPAEPTPSWVAQVQQWAKDAHDTAEQLAQDVESWEAEIDAAVDGAENVDATVSKSGVTATITVADRNGTPHTASVSDGATGAQGPKGDKGDKGDTGATGPQGPAGEDYVITSADYAAIAQQVESDIQPIIENAQDAASDATAAAAEARAASAATWLSGNVLFGELAEGTVLTADDAFAAPPKGVEVYGVSTQDGTPTPDVPVEIKSVDDLTLLIRGKNLLCLTDTTEVTQNGVTYSAANNVISISGTPTADFDIRFLPKDVKERYHFTAGEKVSFSSDNVPSNVRVTIMHQGGGGICDLPTNNVTINPVWLYVGAIRLRFTSGSAVNASFSIQMEQGAAATTFEPYIGQSIPIPLSNHVGRSLPDGTRDTLNLAYLRPSTRPGWAWYSREVTRRATTEIIDGSETDWWKSTSYAGGYYRRGWADNRGIPGSTSHLQDRFVTATSTATYMVGTCLFDGSINFRVDSDLYPTLADFKAWLAENPVTVQYPLATPVTTTLDPIELPELPAPTCTVWCDGGSAQPTLAMEYERALSIVIPRIEAQLADLATS